MFDKKLIIWFCSKELPEILYRLTAVYHLQPKIRTMSDITLRTVLSAIKVAGGMAVVTVPIWMACTFTDNTRHMQTVSTGLRGKDTSTRQKEQKWRSGHKRFKPVYINWPQIYIPSITIISFTALRFMPRKGNFNFNRRLKGAVSRQSSSFCLILPITRPQSVWNLK